MIWLDETHAHWCETSHFPKKRQTSSWHILRTGAIRIKCSMMALCCNHQSWHAWRVCVLHGKIWSLNSNLDRRLLGFNGSDGLTVGRSWFYSIMIKWLGFIPFAYTRAPVAIMQAFFLLKICVNPKKVLSFLCNAWRIKLFFSYRSFPVFVFVSISVVLGRTYFLIEFCNCLTNDFNN